jgi:hypothetical protein
MNRLLHALCLVALLAILGCGGTSSGHLPVDSPLTTFVPPDRQDLVADVDDEDSGDAGDAADEDWGESDETPASETPAPAPSKPAKSK